MKTASKIPSVHRQTAVAHEPAHPFTGASRVDHSPAATAQRQLTKSIQQSPRMMQQKSLASEIVNSPRAIAQREQLQGMFATAAQGPEEGELRQGKFTSSPTPLEQESAPSPNKTGLPDKLKSGIESLSGMSMDQVKVHYNSSQPAQLNALAYAQGSDIHVAPGQEQHLPHEAWHVVQQAQGRVKPTMQMKDGMPVNDSQGLEQEADVMGVKANKTAQLHRADGSPGCGCPSCTSQRKSASKAPIVESGLAAGAWNIPSIQMKGVLQLYCETCMAIDGVEREHSLKNCPHYAESDSDTDETYEEKELEEPKKKQGWQKSGNSKVKMGKGERDLRKRSGHGMMTKEQAKRYIPGYKEK
ncbi:MAG: DUF4157 domain-containing protein [Methylococcaceae bacterium]|nr:DUF4157 domain-containing protein [Methylococcaceae bacterium]